MLTLKEIREIKGVSQQDVSDIFSISKRTIEGWESGARKAPHYVVKMIADKLLHLTAKEVEYEKTYCVVEYDFNAGTNVVKTGSKNECVRFEDTERKKLSQEEQLFRNYRTVRISDYEKELEYSEALDKYRATLSEQQLSETVEINGKTYAKYVLDFQKKYFNN